MLINYLQMTTLLFRIIAVAILLSGISCTFAQASTYHGYDLYSWRKNNDWYYTILAGEDRTRDPVEIRWSHGRVKGAYQLKEEILHLPEGSVVSWRCIDEHGLVMPPHQIVDDIRLYAESVGVKLRMYSEADPPKPYIVHK